MYGVVRWLTIVGIIVEDNTTRSPKIAEILQTYGGLNILISEMLPEASEQVPCPYPTIQPEGEIPPV